MSSPLAQAAFGSFIVLAAACGLGFLLRRACGRCRHALWSGAIVAVLALPMLSALDLRLPVLPAAPPETPVAIPLSPPTLLLSSTPGDAPAPPTIPAPPAPRPQGAGWEAVALGVWLIGAAFVLARFVIGLEAVERLARGGRDLDDHSWRDLLERIAGELRLRRSVRLCMHARAGTPMTWGFLRPVVLLPRGCQDWSPARRAVVLRHELSHVKRGDWLFELAARLACALYWFNPLVWVAARQLARAREHACDETVVGLGTQPSAYADHLMAIARGLGGSKRPALAMARLSHLEQRLMRILTRTDDPRPTVGRLAGSLTLIAVVVALVAAPPTRAVDPEPAPAPVLLASLATQDTDLPSRRLREQVRVQRDQPLRLRHLAGEVEIRQRDVDEVSLDAVAYGDDDRLLGALEWAEGRDAEGRPVWHLTWPLDELDEIQYPRLEPERKSKVSKWNGHDLKVVGPQHSEAPVLFADLVVTIPLDTGLALRLGVGAVQGKQLEGNVAIKASHAPVRLSDVEGDLAVGTGAGKVTLSEIDGKLTIATGAGSIEIADLQGGATLLTGAGDISIDGGRVGTLSARSGAGDVDIHLSGFETATLNSGAGSITIASPLRDAKTLTIASGAGSITVLAETDAAFHLRAGSPLGRLRVGYDDADVDRRRGTATRGTGGTKITLSTGTGDCTINPM
jgi:beta-lactamase regulating signal transducer with metallopeptidase domain